MESADLGRRRRASLRIAALLATVAFALPAHADTVEILVRERAGRPISDQAVTVHPPVASDQELWLLDRATVRRGKTGADGKVAVDGLPAGRYAVTLGAIADPNLIDPRANPYAPPPIFTLGSGQETVAVEIELWRGVVLTSDILLDRGNMPPSRLVVRSLDGAATLTVLAGENGRAEHLLVPGRWEVALQIPPGYLLVDVAQNGEPRPGASVRIDVLDVARSQHVTWSLSARALVSGRVARVNGPGCGGTVLATLIEPGPWYPDVVARGGSEFRRVPAQRVELDCSYVLWLPDGRWRLEAVGDRVVESIPESVDLTLAPGDARDVDFAVRTSDDGAKAALMVRVTAPDETGLAGAVVEIWPAERNGEDRPLRTAKTKAGRGFVEFRDLPAGDFLIVAGHTEYLENSERLPEFDPEATKPRFVKVTLREGGRITGRAVDENLKPVREVALDIVRIGEPPRTVLADEELAARKISTSVLTDLTGRAIAPGLPAGTYRVSGRVSGELAGTRFVRVRRGEGEPAPELDVQLEETTRLDLDLVVRPAASLAGRLACTDGRNFPARASFRVFPAGGVVPDPWRAMEIRKDAALALDDVGLTGDQLDHFRVGPLPPGAYLLAVRPAGHEYWSWVHDVLVPDAASILHAAETSILDIGITPLECSPLVMIAPQVRSGEAVPDFRSAEIDVDLAETDVGLPGKDASAGPGGKEKRPAAFAGDLDRHESRAFLRRLPEGAFKLSVAVRHPYLIPSSLVLPEQAVDLVRGKLVTLAPVFRSVGGLVEVYGARAAARLVPTEGDPVIGLAVDTKVSFPGTAPGSYRVEACDDATCQRVSHAWERVDVAAARTAILRAPP